MRVLIFLTLIFNFLIADSLIFGVVPQQSPAKLYRVWQPIIEKLSKEVGIKIIFKTEKSIPEFRKNVYKAKYDIIYVSPADYAIATKRVNYQAILRAKQLLEGILVVKKNSNIKTLKDIIGKSFIFPAPLSIGATLLTKHEILEKLNYNIDSSNIKYVNSHDSVYKAVARGIGEVGGGIKRTFNLMSPEIKDKLKIIYTTKEYPSHPIAIRGDLKPSIKEKIRESFLSFSKKDLKNLNIKNFIDTNDSEYDTIRKLVKDLNIKDE